MTALAVVVGLAVLREGAEVVLFLYGIVAAGTSGSVAVARRRARASGRRSVHRADLLRAARDSGTAHLRRDDRADRTAGRRHGRAGGAVPRRRGPDQRAGATDYGTAPAWLPQDGIVGRLLHTLIGYTDRPTELQLDRLSRHARGHGGADLDGGAARGRSGRRPENLSASREPSRKNRECDVGSRSITLSNARAGPRGERLPCSQLRTVSIGTPMRAANCGLGELGARAHAASIGGIRAARPCRQCCPTAVAHLLRDFRKRARQARARFRREESRRSGRRPSV